MFPSYYVSEEEFRQSPALQEAVASPMELSALVRLVQAVQGGEASEDARRGQARVCALGHQACARADRSPQPQETQGWTHNP